MMSYRDGLIGAIYHDIKRLFLSKARRNIMPAILMLERIYPFITSNSSDGFKHDKELRFRQEFNEFIEENSQRYVS